MVAKHAADGHKLLLLFSSNVRPLYAQDILNVYAAPEGTIYEYRYHSTLLNKDANDAWDNRSLGGVSVAVLFSLQDDAQFQDPVFLPVRLGTVTSTRRVDDLCFVAFRLGAYLTLPEPTVDTSPPVGSGLDQVDTGRARKVHEFVSYLDEIHAAHPYACSVALLSARGDEVTGRLQSNTSTQSFRACAAYLQKTVSFRRAYFLRFHSLTEQGSDVGIRAGEDGVFEVRGGRTYALELMVSQPIDFEQPADFTISVDESIVTVIGTTHFSIESEYNVFRVPIFVKDVGPDGSRETTVAAKFVDPSAIGPTITLHLRAQAPRHFGNAAGAGTLFGLSTLAAAISSSDHAVDLARGIAAVGMLIVATGVLYVFRLRRLTG